MKRINLYVKELNAMGFFPSVHKVYGVYFIGLGVSVISLKQAKVLGGMFPDNYKIGYYSAIRGELCLRTDISIKQS